MQGSEVLSRKPQVTAREVDNERILFDEATNKVHFLNSSSSFIWSLLDGKKNLAVIANELAHHYDIPESQAIGDVLEITEDLLGLNLVEVIDG